MADSSHEMITKGKFKVVLLMYGDSDIHPVAFGQLCIITDTLGHDVCIVEVR